MRDLLFLALQCVRHHQARAGAIDPVTHSVGVVVTYSTATQEFAFFTGQDLKPLARQLHAADLVIGYNLSFHFRLLRDAGVRLTGLRALDMHRPIMLEAGGLVALGHILRGTFGWKPRLTLPQVCELNERGDWLKAMEVCCNDVEGMRLIY
jgi:hypothetical protein